MNERILELITSVGLKSITMVDDSNRDVECYVDRYGSVPSVELIEKLIKAVAEECANLCTDQYRTDDGWGITQADRRCCKLIKDSFMVERDFWDKE